MRPVQASLADPSLRAALATGLDAAPSPRTARLAAFIAHAFGPSALALVHYGSHSQQSDASAESARDFFIIVSRYGPAYRSARAAIGTSYRPATATLLNHLLPPNVIAITLPAPDGPLLAKCAVLSLDDLRRACSHRARDHFALGRLFQRVQLVWTRDAGASCAVTDAIVEARALTFSWGRASLPPRFDVETYCRVLLATSFAAEIRPEGGERVDALIAAQRDMLEPAYGPLLAQLAAQNLLGTQGNVYTDPAPPGALGRLRIALYFRRSKLRATARWLKYIALYDDWQGYIVRKISRRSNRSVELTARERRWPLIFLWPKAIRYIRSRPQRRS